MYESNNSFIDYVDPIGNTTNHENIALNSKCQKVLALEPKHRKLNLLLQC